MDTYFQAIQKFRIHSLVKDRYTELSKISIYILSRSKKFTVITSVIRTNYTENTSRPSDVVVINVGELYVLFYNSVDDGFV